MGRYLLFLVCIFGLVQCKVNKKAIVSNYQKNLALYYESLEGNDLLTPLAAVQKTLAERPYDIETRLLRSQIYLEQYKRGTDLSAKRKIIGDLQFIQSSLRNLDSIGDWVNARSYTTFGDLFLLEGNKQRVKTTDSTDPNWTEFFCFYAANQLFGNAYEVANNTSTPPSRGVQMEKNNAIDGIIQANLGMFNFLYKPNLKKISRVKVLADSLLLLTNQLYEGNKNNIVSPVAYMVGFDPDMHAEIVKNQELVAGGFTSQLQEICESSAEAKDSLVNLALQGYRREVTIAAYHDMMSQMLNGKVNIEVNDRLKSPLRTAYFIKPEEICE